MFPKTLHFLSLCNRIIGYYLGMYKDCSVWREKNLKCKKLWWSFVMIFCSPRWQKKARFWYRELSLYSVSPLNLYVDLLIYKSDFYCNKLFSNLVLIHFNPPVKYFICSILNYFITSNWSIKMLVVPNVPPHPV